MGNTRRRSLVDQRPCVETIKPKGRIKLVRLAGRHSVGKAIAAGGDGLEPTRTPATAKIEALYRRFANNRT